MYIDGVKYAVAPAVRECLAQAEERNDIGSDRATCGCTRCTTRHCSPTPSAAGNLDETSRSLGDPPRRPRRRPPRGHTPLRADPAGEQWETSA